MRYRVWTTDLDGVVAPREIVSSLPGAEHLADTYLQDDPEVTDAWVVAYS